MHKLKVAVIGGGFTSQTCHLPCLKQNTNVKIVALAEKRKELRDKVAKKFSIKNKYNNHVDLLNSEKILDLVVVITRRSETHDVVKYCLNKGVNVFSEKPMSYSLKGAKILFNLSKKKKCFYQIGFNKLYDKGIIKGKIIFEKYIKSKKFGKFSYFKFQRFSGSGYVPNIKFIKKKYKYSLKKKNLKNYFNFLIKSNFSLYDTYLNLYSHNISLLNFFFKKIPKVINFINKNNFQITTLDYKSFYGTLETTFKKDFEWNEKLELYFENGKLEIRTYPQQKKNAPASVTIKKRGKTVKNIQIKPQSWSFQNQINSIISKVKNKNFAKNNAKECIDDHILIEKFLRNYEKIINLKKLSQKIKIFKKNKKSRLVSRSF